MGGSGNIIGGAGNGILAEQSATGLGYVLIDGTGNVTGTGSSFDGILAEILNAADVANVTVNQTGNITGGLSGVDALTDGTGNVSVTTGSNVTIAGQTDDGLQARSYGTGSIVVATETGDVISSASSGIVAANRALTVPQVDGSTVSTITVNAYGTINSGPTLTDSGSRPAGIGAAYFGVTTGSGTANSAVFGNVLLNNYANITAVAGDGIRAADFGVGNVTVTDGTFNNVIGGPGTTIGGTSTNGTVEDATPQYGIDALTSFTGNITVSMSTGDSISSGSTGIFAINEATAISALADNMITINADGTIDSGTTLDISGDTPSGIKAGYYGSSGTPDPMVTGEVIVNNSANITAAAGDGIFAYNYGNGDVTVNDLAQTTVKGPIGIGAYQESGGTGDVYVTVAGGASTGAMITGTAYYAIEAYSDGTGNVSVTTGANDTINSSSTGILAINGATAIPETGGVITSTIAVTANGTINSGSTSEGGGFSPAGIDAAYKGDSSSANTPNLAVFGDIIIDDYANITAITGYGIKAFDYGQGNITVNEHAAGTITPASGHSLTDGILAEQESGGSGNITITIDLGATVTGNTGIFALLTGNGTIEITNYGTITGATGQAISFNLPAGDAETISNFGTINGNVMFGAGGGTLMLAQSSTLNGDISGITGSSDVLDLGGFNWVDTSATSGSYNSGTNSTTLTVHDLSDNTTVYLTLVGNYSSSNWVVTNDNNGGADIVDPPAAATIINGGNLEISAPSNETVTFTGATGSLVLNQSESFTGQIIGFTGTAPDAAHSDTIDLVGINYDFGQFAELYNSSTGLLAVTDGSNTASITFDDFNATLDFASDGNGGTLITDPPASGSSGATSIARADWGMKFGDDKFAFASGQATDQSGDAAGPDGAKATLVALHSGSDTFVFHSELNAETGGGLDRNVIAEELQNHPNSQLAQQLTALVTPEAHHQAYMDLFHNDNIVLPSGIPPAQWHETVAGAFHLH